MRFLLPDCIQGYDRVQSLAVILLYIQVASALIGSLGAIYTGVLLANLSIALFALVAIESGSQTLGRTYAALLPCSLLLDICWFILFSFEIRQFDGSRMSLELVLWMEVVGFTVRAFSGFVWFQMYRLGRPLETSYYHTLVQPTSLESTPASTPTTARQISISDEILGGSIYDPTYYSSVFRFQDKASEKSVDDEEQSV